MNRVDLQAAHATCDGSTLIVSTGHVRRAWRLTNSGLATASLVDETSGTRWVDREPAVDDRDWYVFTLLPAGAKCELVSAELAAVTDDPFTSDRVEAALEFRYPKTGLAVRYRVWAYPDAPGLRTQLALKALESFGPEQLPSYVGGSYAERLAFDPRPCARIAAGYYNDPQHRNRDDTPILRRTQRDGDLAEANGGREHYDWASLLGLDRPVDGAGLTLVKESSKCVNQDGIDGGAFILEPDHVRVTGLGMTPFLFANARGSGPWLPQDRFRLAWANWCLLHPEGETQRQLAVKRFDRLRFCPVPGVDLQSRANTWGTRDAGAPARSAAAQDNVLKEIDACADLAIDAMAIDDGWQCPTDGTHPPDTDWRPHPEVYPDGWGPVREAAKHAGVVLDLWIPATVDLKHMTRNFDEAGFETFKLDWYGMPHRDAVDTILDRARCLIEHSGHKVRVSWDVTENMPRVGYYLGREFGSLHTSNRRCSPTNQRIRHVIHQPRLVLRDAWQLARYLNLQQIEVPIVNAADVRPEDANAQTYGDAYLVAASLMGVPLFFQEVHRYDPTARDRIRPLMQKWREHRDELSRGYVFPIGDEPCDAAWFGFQNHRVEDGSGYLLVYREKDAAGDSQRLPLHLVEPGTSLRMTDVLTGDAFDTSLDADGAIPIAIDAVPGFRWLRYKPTR